MSEDDEEQEEDDYEQDEESEEELEEGYDEEPYEEPDEIEEQEEEQPRCDPTIMNCDEMRNKILNLSTERAKYENTIEKLEEIKKTISAEGLDEICKDCVEKKNLIDDEIYGTFEKFTICSANKPKKEDAK